MVNLGSNAAGLNSALEVRMRHVFDQENWLAQSSTTPPVPAVTTLPTVPTVPGGPHDAVLAPVLTVPLVGGGDSITCVVGVFAVVLGCVAVFNLVGDEWTS